MGLRSGETNNLTALVLFRVLHFLDLCGRTAILVVETQLHHLLVSVTCSAYVGSPIQKRIGNVCASRANPLEHIARKALGARS